MRKHLTQDIHDEAGFTLLEVMMAIALLGIGLLAMAAAQLSSLNMSARSQQLSQATYLAEEQMDALMLRSSSDPIFATSGQVPSMDESDIAIDGTSAGDQNVFDRIVIVDADMPMHGMTTITVEVSWKTPGGTTRVSRLQSIR